MAIQEHINYIKSGAEKWNKWRELNPNIVPDLSGVDLSNIKLEREMNLERANIEGANLKNAYLPSAKLDFAILSNANLFGANLRRAHCNSTNFFNTNLYGVDFHLAYVDNANFINANLDHCDFSVSSASGANFHGASIRDMELGFYFPGMVAWTNQWELLHADGLLDVDKKSMPFVLNYLYKCYGELTRDDSKAGPDHPKIKLGEYYEKSKYLIRLYKEKEIDNSIIEIVKKLDLAVMELLKNNPELLYNISPRLFEEIIAELLSNFGWEVSLTKSTRDGGYDIFGISQCKSSGIKSSWLVECKRYSQNRKVGIEVVRSLSGVKADLRVANMLIATTSHFSSDVHAYKTSRYDLELREFEGLIEWLNSYKPNPSGRLWIIEHKLTKD